MSKIVDIKGYYNHFDEYRFDEKHMWEGRIILEDDGWFEGVSRDSIDIVGQDDLIFGVYHEGKVIELLKIEVNNTLGPYVYRVITNEKGYAGTISSLSLFGESPCGVSYIVTGEKAKLKNKCFNVSKNINEKTQDIKDRVEKFTIDNADCIHLYANTKVIRESLTKYVLDRYEGQKFTKGEIEGIVEPVKDIVIEKTISRVKTLTKELELKFKNDDMPF